MELFIDFCNDLNIDEYNKLAKFSFEEIPSEYKYKYEECEDFRATADADNTLIMNAIYVILWGDIFNIENREDIGSWRKSNENKNQPSFRGDTMNSFSAMFGYDKTGWDKTKSVLGEEDNENKKLWDKIRAFRKVYHTIGNFLLIPNRGDVNKIKGASGNLKDSFNLFLSNALNYYNENYGEVMDGYSKVFKINPEYNNNYYSKEEKVFLFKLDEFNLKDYYDAEGNVKDFLEKKEVNFRKKTSNYLDEEKKQYKNAMENYIEFAKGKIEKRSITLAKILFERKIE